VSEVNNQSKVGAIPFYPKESIEMFQTKFLATLLACLVLVGSALANPTSGDEETIIEPSISIEQALGIAEKHGEGGVEMIVLDDIHGVPVFFTVAATDLSRTELVIDGLTGEVLSTSRTVSANAEIHDFITFDDLDEFSMLFDEVIIDGGR